MITSMTGFGRITQAIVLNSGQQITVTVEIKSLNARFFEIFCKLPSTLSSLELLFSNKLKAALYRGKVFFVIKIDEEIGVLEVPTIAVTAVEHYLASIKTLQEKLSIPGTLTINDLVHLPQLFALEKKELQAQDYKQIEDLVDAAIVLLKKERNREGDALASDVTLRLQACEKKIALIRIRFEALLENIKKEIALVTEQVQQGVEHEKPRLEELYGQLNKMDINEEVSRFTTHREALFALLSKKDDEKGRKLDFLLQELFREINTITAKCSDSEITTAAVDIKVEVEKAREQVQNIL